MDTESLTLAFTGERFTPEMTGQIEVEHYHRYLLCQDLAAGKRVLDIASGEGYGSHLLAQWAAQVVGVDVSEEAVAHARRRYRAANLEFRQGSCDAIPLADASVDLVVSFETLEHHARHQEMMAEVRRVLAPGGRLIVSSPDKLNYSDRTGYANPFHVKELYREEFERLLQGHFRRVQLYAQKTLYGSLLLPEAGVGGTRSFWREDAVWYQAAGLPCPTIWIALASDAELPGLPAGALEIPAEDSDPARLWRARAEATQAELARLESLAAAGRDLGALQNELEQWRGVARTRAWRAINAWWKAKEWVVARLTRRPRRTPALPQAPVTAPATAAPEADLLVAQLLQRAAPLLRPLPLVVDPRAPVRVNVLLSQVRKDYMFAGYLGIFRFADRLARDGCRVRIVAVDAPELDLEAAAAALEAHGLPGLLGRVELVAEGRRDQPLPVHPDDRFVVMDSWQAHLAHAACAQLKEKRFLYLIQEYEPIFFQHGIYHAYSRAAYDLPQVRVFSTPMLRDYFAAGGIGADAPGPGARAQAHWFENAVPPIALDPAGMRARTKKKLLFYARVEAYNTRNLFELGLQALGAAIEAGDLDPADWEFHAIGSSTVLPDLPLPRGATLRSLPKRDLADYYALLAGYDLGLSLMLSPHPSLTPLDMAAAGMVVVTNSYANKTAEAMAAVSANILALPATLEGLRQGLRSGAVLAADVDARVRGAQLDWCRDWNHAFHPALMDQVDAFLGPAAAARPPALSGSGAPR